MPLHILTDAGYPYDSDEFAMYKRDYNANKLRSAVFQSFLPVVFPEKAAARQQQMGSAPSSDHQQQTLTLQQLQPLPSAQQQQQQQHQPGDALWPGQFQAFQPGGGQAPPPYSSGGSPPPPPPRRPAGSGAPEPGVAIWHRQHCDSVVANIKQLLDRITGYATRPDALDAVPAIVNLAAELGIEFGVQRAQVWLVMPQRNDLVQAGPEYQDCLGGVGGTTDNDKDHQGSRDLKVDLMVSPGIVRIGDGRGDLSMRKALVPCEVVPYS